MGPFCTFPRRRRNGAGMASYVSSCGKPAVCANFWGSRCEFHARYEQQAAVRRAAKLQAKVESIEE